MTRRLLTVLSLLAIALFAVAPTADAAKKKTKKAALPTVKSITPMQAKPGEKLTIVGTNLKASKKDTRVYFMREGGGLLSAKADTATKTRVIVTIPERIIPLLRGTGQNREPTRFQIRVLAGQFGAPTKLSKSPTVIAPDSIVDPGTQAPADPGAPPDGDCDGDGVKNSVDPDDDNDALTDDIEVAAHTDPCVSDTDGDAVGDGYEYFSAKDLNGAALPYPAKKPWPNPLDSADAKVDHDGDGLDLSDEFLLWKFYGNGAVPLNYSAGLQRSANVVAPADPVLAYMDMDDDGILSDDERDADGDGLGNWDELYGRMTQGWWDAIFNGTIQPKETGYINTFPAGSHVDPDSDGDGVKDGADDADSDGLTNAFEIDRPANWWATYISDAQYPSPNQYPFTSPWNPWARVQPFNPCKPLWSHACHLHWSADQYPPGEDWASIPTSDAGPQPAAPWIYQGATFPAQLPR
jgi:IPT/TIG domain-containing protein